MPDRAEDLEQLSAECADAGHAGLAGWFAGQAEAEKGGDVPDRAVVEKKPEAWLAELYPGMKILDPDGWRNPIGKPWSMPISREEFEQRLAYCTVEMQPQPRAVVDEHLSAATIALQAARLHIDAGIAELGDQPRAIVALSEDRQWLVMLRPDSDPGMWLAYRLLPLTLELIPQRPAIPDTGQDAHKVLAAWMEGRGG